jgi:tRNA A-37 threonylcarbamoyl transferase component Bud32
MRFERETATLETLAVRGITTPWLVSKDDARLSITMQNFTGTDQKAVNLRTVLLSENLNLGAKHAYLVMAFRILLKIHAFGFYHGDAMAKNFNLDSPTVKEGAEVFAVDFELSRGRNLDEATALDIITLVADVSNTLLKARPGATRELAFNQAIAALESGYYGFEIPKFRFTWRDKILYRFGYGMGKEFFEYFSQ